MSCRDCVFRGIFQDMGASCDVCNLQSDLADAVKACENSAGCRHRFTVVEAKKIVIEREGGLPAIPREKTEPSEESDPQENINDAFKRVVESACKAANALASAAGVIQARARESAKAREQFERWSKNMEALKSGALGDDNSPETLLMYWQMQEQAGFPYASENVKYFEDMVAERKGKRK